MANIIKQVAVESQKLFKRLGFRTTAIQNNYVIVVMTNGNKHTDVSKAVGTISISPTRTKTLEKSSYKEGYGWFSSFHSCVFENVKQGDIIKVNAPARLGHYVVYGVN